MLDENDYKEGPSFDLNWVLKFEALKSDLVDELNLRDQQLQELTPLLTNLANNVDGVFG